MIKDKYEISIWDDYLDSTSGYYKDKKIAIIGSDTMTTNCRAYDAKLVQNINGTNTFTFKMYYIVQEPLGKETFISSLLSSQSQELQDSVGQLLITDEITVGRMVGFTNPFINLLTNERKIKCKWKNQWYDLVIKIFKKILVTNQLHIPVRIYI